MPALSVADLLRVLEIDEHLAEYIEGFPCDFGLPDLMRAGPRDELLSSWLISALAGRFSADMGENWPELEGSLENFLRGRTGDAVYDCWIQVLSHADPVMSLWGPPGAFIEYTTEYRVLELRADHGTETESLFLVLLHDERQWEGAPEIITTSLTRDAAMESAVNTLASEYGEQVRAADPALTFNVNAPSSMLWQTLDEMIGTTFSDWATSFRKAVEAREWIERDFIVERASRGEPDRDPVRVREVIEQILAGDPHSLDDLPSDAFDILRAAYRAAWEGHEWF